jgi:hypothetical protein
MSRKRRLDRIERKLQPERKPRVILLENDQEPPDDLRDALRRAEKERDDTRRAWDLAKQAVSSSHAQEDVARAAA